jgi:ribosomal protein S18 acetylase RimI-like enzyme
VARSLVRRCESLARHDPTVDAIALHVDPANVPARRLYESQGYEAVTRRRDSCWQCLLGVAEQPNGLLLMIKPLRDIVLTGAGPSATAGWL